jgi:hypothetical protein
MILTIGDSVSWGQGLLDEHKFDFLLAQAQDTAFLRLAHSGATIGTRTDSGLQIETGEIPVSSPTLWQQTLAHEDWSQVDIVLVNGGINDVSLTRILSPWTSTPQLNQWIDQFCNHAMQDLLIEIAGRLTQPHARIAVLGYYPVLSNKSAQNDAQLQSLLEIHGVASTSILAPNSFTLGDFVPTVVRNCLTFWRSSDIAFRNAVEAVNTHLDQPACIAVPLPFTEENAMWAPHSLLWDLNTLLLPEDEVAELRSTECEALYGDLVNIPQWIQCVRASAGHPNVLGSALIATTVEGAL